MSAIEHPRLVALLGLLVAGCAPSEHEPSGNIGGAAAAVEAEEVIADLRQRFRLGPTRVLPDAEATGFVATEGGWRPRIASSRGSLPFGPARVELPQRADRAFVVRDEPSGLSMEVRLVAASASRFESVEGYAVYRDALGPGQHVVHRPTYAGTEDYILFAEAPNEARSRYEIEWGGGVAGVRFVSNTVELLDGDGTPRLRMAPPVIIDSAGRPHPVSVSVGGCDVDVSPAAPWGRPVTDPSASACTITLAWEPSGVTYPALLDPAWTLTNAMVEVRRHAAAARLADGRVFVVGDEVWMGGGAFTTTTEIYDPATETWSPSGSASSERWRSEANLLPDGTVLVSGGWVQSWEFSYEYNSVSNLRYFPSTGMLAPVGGFDCTFHTATTLTDGRVLLAGGQHCVDSQGCVGTGSQIFDSTTGYVSAASPGKHHHRAARLLDGTVLAVGGNSVGGTRYDPATDSWTPTATPASSTTSLALLADGTVLKMGDPAVAAAERYDPIGDLWSPVPAPNTADFTGSLAERMFDGRVVVNGFTGNPAVPHTEIFDPATSGWALAPAPTTIHDTSTVLLSGEVLYASEWAYMPAPAYGELFSIGELAGSPCTIPADCYSGICAGNVCIGGLGHACQADAHCGSGHCADGVCCDAACGTDPSDCQACTAALTGLSDGACAPVLAATVCRPPTSDCDVAESCDGIATSCPVDALAPTGAPCGDQGVECLVNDACDGAGSCLDNGFASVGTACGNSADGGCLNPDICDGGGTCLANDEPAGTPCGDPSDTACTNPDTCDANAVCLPNDEPWAAPCGDQGDPCLVNDHCDGLGACLDMGAAPATTLCRPVAGACDVPEYCTGSGACLPDDVLAAGAMGSPTCGPLLCDGVGASCPASCASDGDCVASHYCDPTGACLPQQTNGSACDAANQCLSGHCVDGVCCDTACGDGDPSDCQSCALADNPGACTPLPALLECRSATGECDAAESCDGTNALCPANALLPDGTACSLGTCQAGSCVPEGGAGGSGGGGGSGQTGGSSSVGGGLPGPSVTNDSGCSTRGSSAPSAPPSWAWLAALGLTLRRRRQRRSSESAPATSRGGAG